MKNTEISVYPLGVPMQRISYGWDIINISSQARRLRRSWTRCETRRNLMGNPSQIELTSCSHVVRMADAPRPTGASLKDILRRLAYGRV